MIIYLYSIPVGVVWTRTSSTWFKVKPSLSQPGQYLVLACIVFEFQFFFNWTVSVISCHHSCKDCNARFTMVENFISSSMNININVFVSLNCLFSFAISLRKRFAHFLFKKSNGETRRKKKHLSNQRNGGSYTFFMRLSLGTVVNLGLPSLHGGSLFMKSGRAANSKLSNVAIYIFLNV